MKKQNEFKMVEVTQKEIFSALRNTSFFTEDGKEIYSSFGGLLVWDDGGIIANYVTHKEFKENKWFKKVRIA